MTDETSTTETWLLRLQVLTTATEREALIREMGSGEVEGVISRLLGEPERVAQYILSRENRQRFVMSGALVLPTIAEDIRAGKHWGKR